MRRETEQFPPSPQTLPHFKMCHWRRVQNTYKKCGHVYDIPDEMIQCDNRFCKFSTTHPPDCAPPGCTDTCWQYRQFPKEYYPQIDDHCPDCACKKEGNKRS